MRNTIILGVIVAAGMIGRQVQTLWAAPGIAEAGDLTPRQVLGMKLFFDPDLSANGKVSCATCHDPDHGFASHGKPLGLDGLPLRRKAPSLYDRDTGKSFFWDGRSATLEEQATQPILHRLEMGNTSMKVVLERLEPKYGEAFRREYTNGLTRDSLAHAIAEYERTIQHPSDRLEHHLAGRGDFNDSELRGYELFRGKAGCYKCHPAGGSDEKFHNTGLGGIDLGRFYVTRRQEDKGKFKTPTLRGCSLTAPYMHDASLRTLEEVVEFYDKGGNKHDTGTTDVLVFPLRLTPREREDLVSFLKGL